MVYTVKFADNLPQRRQCKQHGYANHAPVGIDRTTANNGLICKHTDNQGGYPHENANENTERVVVVEQLAVILIRILFDSFDSGGTSVGDNAKNVELAPGRNVIGIDMLVSLAYVA